MNAFIGVWAGVVTIFAVGYWLSSDFLKEELDISQSYLLRARFECEEYLAMNIELRNELALANGKIFELTPRRTKGGQFAPKHEEL